MATSCCLELGLKTLLKKLLTARIPFSFFRCDFTYGIKQGRTSPWGEPIERLLLGPEVAVQLPVSSVSLEPEQSPGAPGTKPNPSSDSWLLSMEREWFMGALSGGTCTDFWRVTVWHSPLQHGLVFAVCWLTVGAGSDLTKLYTCVFQNSPAHPFAVNIISPFLLRCLKPSHCSLDMCLTIRNMILSRRKKSLFSLSKKN